MGYIDYEVGFDGSYVGLEPKPDLCIILVLHPHFWTTTNTHMGPDRTYGLT